MSMKEKYNVLTRFIGKQGFKLKHASPTLLTVGGVVALVGAGVLAIRETPKLDEHVADLEIAMSDIRQDEKDGMFKDDPKAAAAARGGVYVGFSMRVLRVYAKPLAVAAIGSAAIFYSHGVMRKREASLVAAYGVLERAYSAYRARVEESFGPEVEQDLYNGNKLVDHKWNKETKKVEYEVEKSDFDTSNEYKRIFSGKTNKNWNSARPEWNLVFLRGQEKFANHLLEARGHVFLNDVLDGLGFPRTPAGAVTGWVRNGPDGYIDFGLFDAGTSEEQDYFYFYNDQAEIVLDFNVDGVIYDKI